MSHRRSPLRLARLGAILALAAAWNSRPTALADDSPPEPTLAWRSDYGAALEEARAADRLLWIQFTGPWCPNCLRMEQESFTSPAVASRTNREFIAVKLRADENQELALGFNLSGLPASVVVDASRNVLAVHQGYLGPEDLDGLLGRVASRKSHRVNSEDLADVPGGRPEFVGPPDPGPIREPATLQAVKKEEHVELSGYCPVSLIAEKKLVEGQPEYAVNYRGRLYQFANLVTFNRFRRDPDLYVPANDGRCPVEKLEQGRELPGDPRYGALYNGRLYLCATRDDRARFLLSPERYATVGVEDGGNCPHCLAENGVSVPGDPRFSLTQGNRRYWFPDESHRNAFMSLAPSDTLRR